MHPRSPILLAVLAVVLALAVPVSGEEPRFSYEDLPASFHHQMTAEQIESSIIDNNLPAQRAHAWALWSALTVPSHSFYRGQAIPIWQTWLSDDETFSENPGTSHPTVLDACCTFKVPLQNVKAHAAFGGKSARVLSFVRYNFAAHEFIVRNGYNRQATLNAVVAADDKNNQPVQLRALRPFPREAVVLKSTFWLIKNPHGRKGTASLTPLPYWDPAYPPPSGGRVPSHLTWLNCVAVDPANNYADGAIVIIPCNGRTVKARVIHMDRFASLRVTNPSDVAVAQKFAKQISMHTDQEHVVTSQFTPEVGDWIMLTAMHVMTREIEDWTFQTFWWTPFPNAAPFGNDRPASVRGKWRNYDMCNAYNEVLPRTAAGGPHICFDPYLEADLGPTKPYVLAGVKYAADPMAGTRSNCMACHSRAGWPAHLDPPYTTASNLGRVFNPGYVPRTAPYYRHIVTSQMLWSIPLQARAVKAAK